MELSVQVSNFNLGLSSIPTYIQIDTDYVILCVFSEMKV
jgi:hypothetical protein